MNYVIVHEYYSGKKAILRSEWIKEQSYDKNSTIYSFFDKNLATQKDCSTQYDKSKKFDGKKSGFYKFVVYKVCDDLNEAEKVLNTRISIVPLKLRELNDSKKLLKSNPKSKSIAKKIDSSNFSQYMEKQLQCLDSISVSN